MKYQGIVTPDGITVSLCGPFGCAMDDQSTAVSSGIMDALRRCLDYRKCGRKLYAIYGDSKHRENEILIKPFETSK